MKKILIVDDDNIFAKILSDSLPKDKYETLHVEDGLEGLKAMDKEKPDLVVLDLIMPKMGGMEFLEELKKRKDGHQHIPILISSQLVKMKDMSEGIALGMEVGVKGFIVKASENMDMIVKTIARTLGE